jgi:hypothetical protein
MSPASRGRKKKTAQRVAAPEPSLTGVFKAALRDLAGLGTDADRIDAEMVASSLVGGWWDVQAEESPGLDLIDFASRRTSPAAALLLAALREVAPVTAERAAAGAALAGLVAKGIPDPAWSQAVPGDCWWSGDVYGDEITLLCLFERDGAEHGLLAMIGFTFEGRAAIDMGITREPGVVLSALHAEAGESDGLVSVEKIAQGRARRLIEDAVAITDGSAELPVSDTYPEFRAVSLARCRSLGEPDPAPVAEPIGDREPIVEDFLAASGLDDTPQTRACARLLIEFGARTEPLDPLRVGPEKLSSFLLDWQPAEAELSEEEEAVLPDVVLAWARWGAARQDLTGVAVEELVETVHDALANAPVELYLDGVDTDDEVEITEALDRRLFAVPSTHTEIGGEELDLIPADPDQRRLLVIGEHPELHEALSDEGEEGDTARVYLAIQAGVIDQLWDDEPRETWRAAARLLERGLDRDQVLDELGRVLGRFLRASAEMVEGGEPAELEFDEDDYVRALAQLR